VRAWTGNAGSTSACLRRFPAVCKGGGAVWWNVGEVHASRDWRLRGSVEDLIGPRNARPEEVRNCGGASQDSTGACVVGVSAAQELTRARTAESTEVPVSGPCDGRGAYGLWRERIARDRGGGKPVAGMRPPQVAGVGAPTDCII